MVFHRLRRRWWLRLHTHELQTRRATDHGNDQTASGTRGHVSVTTAGLGLYPRSPALRLHHDRDAVLDLYPRTRVRRLRDDRDAVLDLYPRTRARRLRDFRPVRARLPLARIGRTAARLTLGYTLCR